MDLERSPKLSGIKLAGNFQRTLEQRGYNIALRRKYIEIMSIICRIPGVIEELNNSGLTPNSLNTSLYRQAKIINKDLGYFPLPESFTTPLMQLNPSIINVDEVGYEEGPSESEVIAGDTQYYWFYQLYLLLEYEDIMKLHNVQLPELKELIDEGVFNITIQEASFTLAKMIKLQPQSWSEELVVDIYLAGADLVAQFGHLEDVKPTLTSTEVNFLKRQLLNGVLNGNSFLLEDKLKFNLELVETPSDSGEAVTIARHIPTIRTQLEDFIMKFQLTPKPKLRNNK